MIILAWSPLPCYIKISLTGFSLRFSKLKKSHSTGINEEEVGKPSQTFAGEIFERYC